MCTPRAPGSCTTSTTTTDGSVRCFASHSVETTSESAARACAWADPVNARASAATVVTVTRTVVLMAGVTDGERRRSYVAAPVGTPWRAVMLAYHSRDETPIRWRDVAGCDDTGNDLAESAVQSKGASAALPVSYPVVRDIP